MVDGLINEEAVFVLGCKILKYRMRKSPRWGWGQLIRALGKGSFNEDWEFIRLNLNLFEYKSPPNSRKRVP